MIWQWLTEKAKFPRFVWIVLSLGVLLVGLSVALKVQRATDVVFNVSDKFQMAVQEQKEAIKERKEALKERKEASELLTQMNARFEEAQVSMDRRFDELIARLETMKEKAKRGERVKPVETIELAQMALRKDRDRIRERIPDFQGMKKRINEERNR